MSADEQRDERLTRIETKIDSLSQAVVNIARLDERVIALLSQMEDYDKRQQIQSERISRMYDRIIELEKGSMSVRVIEKVSYIIGSAAVASAFWFLQSRF